MRAAAALLVLLTLSCAGLAVYQQQQMDKKRFAQEAVFRVRSDVWMPR